MKKANLTTLDNTIEKVGNNTTDGIRPFTERPSSETSSKEIDGTQKTAHSLFAYFTANIIKEEVTFIR